MALADTSQMVTWIHCWSSLICQVSFSGQTLIEGNDKKWYVTELCEKLEDLIQLDAGFHGLQGRRNVITFISDAEKDPRVLGFTLTDGDPVVFPVRQDDDEDADIPDDSLEVEGQGNT